MKLDTFQQSVGLFVAILIFFATAGPGASALVVDLASRGVANHGSAVGGH